MPATLAEYQGVTPGPPAPTISPRADAPPDVPEAVPGDVALLLPEAAPAPRTGRMAFRMIRAVVFWFAAFLAVGNLLILATSAWAKSGLVDGGGVEGVKNFRVVDARLWRGAAPTDEGYRALAERGVGTVVDLRAEEDVEDRTELLAGMGVDWVHIPFRDGQTPTDDQVRRFLDAVEASDGPVFVHCGAGVGRTGAMVAAYLAQTGQAGGAERVLGNLAVGPPSLEQIVYAADLDGDFDRPNVAVVAASRVLDAPRRILHNLGI